MTKITNVRKIKALMIINQVKNKDIADLLNVTEIWVSLVLNGRGKSRPVQQAIADALGMEYTDLWSNSRAA